MATEDVKIRVAVDGAQETARDLERVGSSLESVGDQAAAAGTRTESASDRFAEMARTGQTLTQRVQGVAGAVQSLVSAMGSHDRTAGLIASTAGTIAQFSALGSMLGPAGTVGGAIAGVTVAILNMADASDQAAEAAGRHADALQRVQRFMTEARRARLDDAARGSGSFEGASDADLEAMRLQRREMALAAEADLTNPSAVTSILGALGVGNSPEELRGAIAQWEYEIEQIDEEVARRREAMLTDLERDLDASDARIEEMINGPGRGRRGRGAAASADGQARGFSGQGDIGLPGINRTQEDELERRRALMEERLELVRETSDEELEIELENLEAYGRALREAADERKALAVEELEKQQQIDEMALQRREEVAQEMGGLLSGTVQLLGGAIKSIVSGEKSAEDAFRGLAAAFLEMISQYATLKAATEFADAAASFARYDYAGGAAHIGAGLAFTAVAVATGVGAAAINSAPQAPARPEASSGGGQMARGGDVNIIWNSPVVTAQTEAELGRNLRGLLGAAEAA